MWRKFKEKEGDYFVVCLNEFATIFLLQLALPEWLEFDECNYNKIRPFYSFFPESLPTARAINPGPDGAPAKACAGPPCATSPERRVTAPRASPRISAASRHIALLFRRLFRRSLTGQLRRIGAGISPIRFFPDGSVDHGEATA